MASYTIEDIELIRRKSGISYQEAVALLDYHNGNVARALVDLERNGRIKSEASQTERKKSASQAHSADKNSVMKFFSRLYQFRVKVKKEQITIVNLSLLFMLLALLISPHLVLIGLILMLILGYKVTFDKHDKDFAAANLEKMVRNAAQNVKDSVADIAQEFAKDDSPAEERTQNDSAASTRSYYHAASSTTPSEHQPSAPTLQVPVQVESQEGKVTLEQDKDGFTSATIE